jgi:GTPase
MIGNVDSGKSTLVGCLSRSVVDDGRGKARSMVFRHAHEQENGRTSSVGMELMGFRDDGVVPVDIKASRQKLWRDVRARSSKAVTFLDLCGHEKYLKTTVFGLTGMLPDYGMVVVGANMGCETHWLSVLLHAYRQRHLGGTCRDARSALLRCSCRVSKMTKEHMGIAAALRLPVMVIITKIDFAPENVFIKTIKTATKTLKSIKRMPLPLRSVDQVPTAAKGMASGKVAPVICVSNVSGEGLDVLRELLRQLEPRVSGATAAAIVNYLRAPSTHSLHTLGA